MILVAIPLLTHAQVENLLLNPSFEEDEDILNDLTYEQWWSWKDGLGYVAHDNEPAYPDNGTGSMVGDENTLSFTEETIVNGGNQSMPFWFDNNKQDYSNYSEVELTLTDQRDWTEQGVANLSLWFRGNPESVGSFVEARAVLTQSPPQAQISGASPTSSITPTRRCPAKAR